ncbi:hypothetical protein [Roseomonas indoligenes]|uniref:Uncharacterized protein n=1 Tax=Roseomonas indoligenes TaxID=2820811 RepID=A0A940MRM9_9PROT|nr:hypothetical protein [Pararoseomonas indoligenes]MBP0492214.1 hypothetical protein [Pararoseomonas indoligenes]
MTDANGGAADLFEALRAAQKALAMIVSPDAIKQTTTMSAFAAATAAEVQARAALTRAKGTAP